MSDIIRKGCKDIWNAFFCTDASYSKNDIPFCPTTSTIIPSEIIPWDEAKHIYKLACSRDEQDFHHDAFVCFYLDDYKFDGPHGIWQEPMKALEVLQHFSGVITPDFSTYQDFPEPLKIYNTYRMRAFGLWLGSCGLNVITLIGGCKQPIIPLWLLSQGS